MPSKKEQIIQGEDDRREFISKSQKDSVALSICMLQECPALARCGNDLYLYNGKCYDAIGTEKLKRIYHSFVMKYGITGSWNKRGDVIDSVMSYEKLPVIETMNEYSDLLCFNNGILNLSAKELIPHSKDYFFDSAINVDYDPKANSCPNFLHYLSQVFNNDDGLIKNALLLGGYLLDTSCAANKMFLFFGPGGSGKSTLIDTYSMFFHHSMDLSNQITSISLTDLSSDKFKKEALINSRVNFSAEEKSDYIPAEEIKKIVTGDFINVDRKFKMSATFRPKTKLIVAINGKLNFKDTSDGIYRRMLIFDFLNRYKRKEEIDEVKNPKIQRMFIQDLDLFKKIESEKSSILNLFLDNLSELRKNNYQFLYTKSNYNSLSEFRRDSDTVREFLEDNYEVDEECETPSADIFNHYRLWHRQNVQDYGVMKFRSNEMGRRIKEVFGLSPSGRRSFKNPETNEIEILSVYQLKRKVVDLEEGILEVDDKRLNQALGI